MNNIGNNRVNTRLTSDDVAAIKQAIQEISYRMPFLLGLTLEERRKLAKINRSNKLFVADAIEVARENPSVLPYYLTVNDLENDYVLFQQLNEILLPLEQLYEKVRDTQMMAGSEAYQTSLTLYKLTRVAAHAGLPGMDTAHARLKVRFDRQGPQGNSENIMESTAVSSTSLSDMDATV
ncbi:MAG TPA: hypothetical protein PKE68_07015 [Saprospiraceae bacterium]|nr:hypothetical protein [Saprospiraceae bacterium]